ncbi:hypothetical protein NE237_012073 [Protea cynaroides]|uniref:Uncharacterized protein n=1 Tax=Protea cynaroides TaxID=273540 RepID=A0A9Q0GXD0_9MAGN|nr:hypothetical protein NE237_012073 [Protea cynaroides]
MILLLAAANASLIWVKRCKLLFGRNKEGEGSRESSDGFPLSSRGSEALLSESRLTSETLKLGKFEETAMHYESKSKLPKIKFFTACKGQGLKKIKPMSAATARDNGDRDRTHCSTLLSCSWSLWTFASSSSLESPLLPTASLPRKPRFNFQHHLKKHHALQYSAVLCIPQKEANHSSLPSFPTLPNSPTRTTHL